MKPRFFPFLRTDLGRLQRPRPERPVGRPAPKSEPRNLEATVAVVCETAPCDEHWPRPSGSRKFWFRSIRCWVGSQRIPQVSLRAAFCTSTAQLSDSARRFLSSKGRGRRAASHTQADAGAHRMHLRMFDGWLQQCPCSTVKWHRTQNAF